MYVCTSSLDSAEYLGIDIDGFGVYTFPTRSHTLLAHRLEYCEAKLGEVMVKQ